MSAAGSIRLDKLLWFLRFARSRSAAQALVLRPEPEQLLVLERLQVLRLRLRRP